MNYRDYLPSTSFVLIVASVLFSGGLVALAYLQQGGGSHELAVVADDQAAVRQDQDGDGLADWEELAYGSSPTNADTDADGTTDGQEVVDGRDPTVAGPNDEQNSLPTPEEVFALGEDAAAGTDNLTEALSRELFTTIAAAKQSGYDESPLVQDEIIRRALARSEVSSDAKVFSAGDIAILPSSGKAELAAYARAVGSAIIARQSVSFDHTTLAFGNAMETGDEVSFSLLSRYRSTYKSLVTALQKVPVPASLANAHLSLLNNGERLVASFDDMAFAKNDPVRAFGGYLAYQEAMLGNGTVLTALSRHFSDNGILFTETGGESFWREIASEL